ncbi:MAG: peptidylprolyl isomerase, partial [Pseudolabrys sp.]|nr:peptidylprolyl isomerase [Pseudolabrys sp.]
MTLSLFAGRPALRAAAFAALLIASPALAQTKPVAAAADPVLAKVNGVEIRQSDLTVAEQEAGQLPPMSPEQKQDYLISFMSDMILV